MKEIYKISSYIADPHGAIGYLGLKEFLENTDESYYGIFFETAHPIKFADIVENTLKTTIEVPNRLKSILLNLIELALFSMVKLICRDYSI